MVKKHLVSIVIPIYKPEQKVFEEVKRMVKKQTIKAEILENWNMPEAKSMNTGIKNAKGDIIVTLDQDCVPENEFWLEQLIKPLEDKEVVVSVSDLYLTKKYWESYPFFTRILSLKDFVVRRPGMDARGCAYRKKDLIKAGLFNEDPKVIAIESDLYENFKKMGKIVHTGCKIAHLHPMNNSKKIKLDYDYSIGNGKIIRDKGFSDSTSIKRILRGTPILGLLPLLYIFPVKIYPLYFPIYALFSVFQHLVCVYGFWKGFLLDAENTRNTEVLNQQN